MMYFWFVFLCVVQMSFCSDIYFYQPEQIHIAFGENLQQIVVTWSTLNDTTESIVEYGINGLILKAIGSSTEFVDDGTERHAQYIHRVLLDDLSPNSRYGIIKGYFY